MNNRFFTLIFIVVVFIFGGLLYIYNPEPIEYKNPRNEVVCADDVKLCPDGSYVGRSGPNCTFDPCPIPSDTILEDGTLPPEDPDTKINEPENPDGIVCTMEVKQCPDGSFVGREGPNCEFKKCPETQSQ